MPSHIASSDLSPTETAACGGLAGMAARFVISPLDVVKIRLQIQAELQPNSSNKYKGLTHAFRVIASEEGIRGFFKGNMSAEYLYVSYGISQLFAYHHFDVFFESKLASSPRAFVCGMLAGSFATAVTYPFDLLRTRFAIQGQKKIYTTVGHAIADIYRMEGMCGFYRGLIPSITQIMPYMGIMFLSYDAFCSTFAMLRENGILDPDRKLTHATIAGSMAGALSKAGVFPLDVVRKRLQVQGPHRNKYIISSIPRYSNKTSTLSCLITIARTEGTRALYKGLTPGLLKAAPSSAAYFLVFEFSKDTMTKLKRSNRSGLGVNLTA
ncbi:mitochondrial carrier domain-containing protein [Dichotomocladium elegans]|nr:mitochondrial carrier domain-containing protein [Dichotomocladium elegans]